MDQANPYSPRTVAAQRSHLAYGQCAGLLISDWACVLGAALAVAVQHRQVKVKGFRAFGSAGKPRGHPSPNGLLQNRQCAHPLRQPALIVSTFPSISTHIPGIPGAKLPGTKEKWR